MFAGLTQKAPDSERLFCCFYRQWLILPLLLLLASANLAADPLCPPTKIDRTATVTYVFDGDTVRLKDGEKVRFIGINTPELARKGKPAQPLASAATAYLKQLLNAAGNRISLRYDNERRDRYGRLLAYVYTTDGDSIAARLLEAGLATTLFVPPNLSALSCFQLVEASARLQKRGLWAKQTYQPIETRQLANTERGFRIIRGRVQRVGVGRRNIWLNLPGNVAVRIAKKDLIYFRHPDPRDLQGHTIIARGWLYERKGQRRLQVRHPYALEVLKP